MKTEKEIRARIIELEIEEARLLDEGAKKLLLVSLAVCVKSAKDELKWILGE